MENTTKLKSLVGNLKALILKGESCMFVDHHIVNFLNKIDAQIYTGKGEAFQRLDKLATQVDASQSDINHSAFHVMFLNRELKMLEPLSKSGMMPALERFSIYGQQPSL